MTDFTAINDNIKEEDTGEAPEAPKTPVKRKNGAQGGNPKKAKIDTPKSSGRNIKASKIPETFDELEEQDRMVIEWKERGEGWNAINEEWKRITGNMPGKSTLPNRYPRLKASLACVAIEAEIKDMWNKKWARVSKHMEDADKQSYPAATLEKHYKKMKAAGTLIDNASGSAPAEADGAGDAGMED
ncbi:hypothetical protein FKW77_004619 [Venturia effusa]|uniref:Uncharacterized protein n=1 Tax=Venturia effusa TaxID=50376 RepID=A0A517L177_9PEZI|nr:hypothetical protein FKW77_004619 [Venturia effusa]